LYALRTNCTHMEPNGGRTRSTVERESKRTPWPIDDIAGKEHSRFNFTFTILDRHHAGSCGVIDCLPADSNRMLCYDWRFFRSRGCGWLLSATLLCCLCISLGCCSRLLLTRELTLTLSSALEEQSE